MAIINPKFSIVGSRVIRNFEESADEIPFVPAWDLYQADKDQNKIEEISLIALALWHLLPIDEQTDGYRNNLPKVTNSL